MFQKECVSQDLTQVRLDDAPHTIRVHWEGRMHQEMGVSQIIICRNQLQTQSRHK